MLVPLNTDGSKKSKKDYSPADEEYMKNAAEREESLKINRAIVAKQRKDALASLSR